jgi:dolichol kinase
MKSVITTGSSTLLLSYYTIIVFIGIILILLVIVLQRYIAQCHQHSDTTTTSSTLLTSSEAKRRIQHGMTGCLLIAISYCIPIYMCIVLLIVATYMIYYLKTYHFHTIYLPNFGPLLRDYEKKSSLSSSSSEKHPPSDKIKSPHNNIPLPGAFYFILGTTITTILFPIHIARYSVLCLSLADPMAAYIGQLLPSYRIDEILFLPSYFHKHRNIRIVTTNATLSGCIACFITAWWIGYILLVAVPSYETTTSTTTTISTTKINHYPILTVTAGAMACCIAEAIPFIHYGNDNVQIPIFTALIVTIVSTITTW